MNSAARRGARAALAVAAFIVALTGAARAAAKPVALAPDFTLADDHGRPFTLSHERGKPVVLFFGYAHCPDVCPTILANLKRARETIGAGANDIVVALVTVDPDRDKPAVLRTFLSAFDPAYVGLTGTDAQLRPIYRAYHVQVVKGSANGSDYLVSHTTFVYYIGRDGRFRGYGTWNDPQDILIENLREITGSAR